MFFCEYCEIFNNNSTYFVKHLQAAGFNFFNGSLLHGPKGLRSRFYDQSDFKVRVTGLIFIGISRREVSPNLHSKT